MSEKTLDLLDLVNELTADEKKDLVEVLLQETSIEKFLLIKEKIKEIEKEKQKEEKKKIKEQKKLELAEKIEQTKKEIDKMILEAKLLSKIVFIDKGEEKEGLLMGTTKTKVLLCVEGKQIQVKFNDIKM